MKDLKRKIHYWCSDTMRNKITGKGVVCAVLDTGITQHPDLVGYGVVLRQEIIHGIGHGIGHGAPL